MKNDEELNERLTVPHDCYIILTAKCNMRCRHCYGRYGSSIPAKELSGQEWDAVFDDLDKNGVFFVNISGGEPTLHPDFIDILASLAKHKMYFILTTNGVFSEKILEAIISVKEFLVGIKISLDGSSAEAHSFLRRDCNGKANDYMFKKTLSTIKKLKKNSIPFSIATCLHKQNIHSLNDFLSLIIDLEPVSWYISTISVDGRSLDNSEIFVSDAEVSTNIWDNIVRICSENNIYVKFIDMPYASRSGKSKNFRYTCPAAKLFCEISSDGIVSPCPLARLNIPKSIIQFDNILNNNIRDIWNGQSFAKFLKLSKEGCDGCLLKANCGRCIPQSYAWFNTHNKPTPYCISNGENLGLSGLEELKQELNKNAKRLNQTLYEEK